MLAVFLFLYLCVGIVIGLLVLFVGEEPVFNEHDSLTEQILLTGGVTCFCAAFWPPLAVGLIVVTIMHLLRRL